MKKVKYVRDNTLPNYLSMDMPDISNYLNVGVFKVYEDGKEIGPLKFVKYAYQTKDMSLIPHPPISYFHKIPENEYADSSMDYYIEFRRAC